MDTWMISVDFPLNIRRQFDANGLPRVSKWPLLPLASLKTLSQGVYLGDWVGTWAAKRWATLAKCGKRGRKNGKENTNRWVEFLQTLKAQKTFTNTSWRKWRRRGEGYVTKHCFWRTCICCRMICRLNVLRWWRRWHGSLRCHGTIDEIQRGSEAIVVKWRHLVSRLKF